MKKLEQEELETLLDQEKRKMSIIREIGYIEIRKHELNHLFAQIQQQQEAYKNALEEKYGRISINLEDGTFEDILEELQHEEA